MISELLWILLFNQIVMGAFDLSSRTDRAPAVAGVAES